GIIILLLVIATATLNSPANPDDIATSPRVTFRPDQSRYLSTESASGTLTIENTTSSEIGYSPGSGSFLIREPDGSQREDNWIKTVGRPIATYWIKPGDSQKFHIGLPRCDVVYDPCAEHVAVKLSLYSKTQQSFPITTPEFSYVFVPDPNATFGVDGLRLNRPLFIVQTRNQESADAVARFLDAEPLDGARGLSSDNSGNDTGAFVGARAITSIPQTFGSVPAASEYLGDRWVYVGPPSLSATIAADRPEIFALVGLRKERCERLGYDCDAVAVVLAARRARSLARSLGVGVRYVSLVALYQDSSWIGHDTLVPLGIAMTMTGETSAAWRRLPTPTPQPSGLVTFGVVRPISTGMPFMMTRRTPAPDPVPIIVPDEASTIVALGDVQKTITVDELRVDIRIDSLESSDSASANLPDPWVVAATLRTQPGVVDAAGQADRVGEFPVVYDMLLKTYNRGTVDRLIAMLRRAYSPLHIGLRYGTSSAISNCDDAIDRAYAASSLSAMKKAVDAAYAGRRQLRRLVLAVAYPPIWAECAKGPQLLAPEWIYNDRLEWPSDHIVRIDARVKLVFRTSK
ncbi:MAG TPA: hypothetical protein VGQ96_02005, partial [Candidatus Eremiobacteraceae bacterium]|nr:hypothetical protein [Candidatus Eremiobacteraceae bacterium]